MTVTLSEGPPDERLDKVNRGSKHALVYQSRNFLNLIAAETNAQPSVIYAYQDDRLDGALPYLTFMGDYGPVLNSLAYYGSHGGAISATESPLVKANLTRAFFETAKNLDAASATIISSPFETDAIAYENSADDLLQDARIGQITYFPKDGSDESLLASFDSVRRRNIRKAIKSGVTVRHGHSNADIQFLYDTHQQNIAAIGGLPKQLTFFERVKRLMGEDEWSIYIAEIDKQPVAALLLMYCNKTVEYFTPAIVEDYRSEQPLALLVYEAMKNAMYRGFLRWNWGGTWLSQKGVYQFKKKWGTQDHPYYYYSKVFNPEILDLSIEIALAAYPSFYLYPFSKA